MSINLNDPIKIFFDEIEIDDYLPSIKFKIDINIKQLTHHLAYSGEIWIDCNVWDLFSKGLNKGESAVLHDMSNIFIIKIIKKHDDIEFTWSVKRQAPEGNVMTASYSSKITDDVYSLIRNEFTNYPKWW
ncbi:hypothetical protein ACFX2V_07150 [Gilliamella apicola]|uniref:hypothetical protein n=1 Tax=Gilliamella apicola TaxID=1196095 RepID=UPI00398726FB